MSAVRDEREQSLEDRRFCIIAGAQWEGPLTEQYKNKPKLEVNKVHLAAKKLASLFRSLNITVSFKRKDGTKSDIIADKCEALYRADEQASEGKEAYNTSFGEASIGGFGGYRYRAVYVDESDPENEEQRISIEPIVDYDTSVYFDQQAKRQDKSDARQCFVLTSMTREAYEEEWGDDPDTWPKDIEQNEFDWSTPDVVYVAEYYEVEQEKVTVHVWKHLDGREERYTEEEIEEAARRLEAIGAKGLRQREVYQRRVHKYILSGGKILEDCGLIVGPNIPVVPVYGERWFVDNVERCRGIVRLAKDSQRAKNMQMSKLAEISALGSVERPILLPEQVAGHQEMWENDNLRNYPYLLVNPVTDMNGNDVPTGPVGYTRTAQVPQALAALLQITEDDMKEILGTAGEPDTLASNVSEGTVELMHNRIDAQFYVYIDNMASSIRRGGEIWLGMAKEIYVEEGRKLKGVGPQGEVQQIELNAPMLTDDGDVVRVGELDNAKFDVVVDVGPASDTQRAATVRALSRVSAMTDDPETKQVLGAMAVMNMEGEGVSDVREYFRKKLLRMGVIQPSEEEAQTLQREMEAQEPTPQDKYFEAAAAKELAEASEKQANTILKQAQADETRADTVKTLTETDLQSLRAALDTIERLGPRVMPPSVQGSEVLGA
jgi:hypothetical protein